jgi:hypothetical protein
MKCILQWKIAGRPDMIIPESALHMYLLSLCTAITRPIRTEFKIGVTETCSPAYSFLFLRIIFLIDIRSGKPTKANTSK